MQILNLTDPNKGDIEWHISHFPDGEVQIILDKFSHKDKVEVHCRITSTEELFILMQVADILNRHGVSWSLNIYYLMGMRMDRVMDFDRPFTLKVIVDILDNLGATCIEVFNPHSEITLNLFKKTPVSRLKANKWSKEQKYFWGEYQIVLPDTGAVERYFRGNPPSDIILGEKVRNIETGRILSIKIKNPEAINGRRSLIVIDDLCDGGGTFVGIAKAIREVNSTIPINIAVDHMVNSKGLENLSAIFNHVYFTNSYKDWTNCLDLPNNVTQINII